jgi:replicative DNA helicase
MTKTPFSAECEQQILGALLANPANFDRVAHNLRAEMFHDPVHVDIFKAISSRYRNGHLADTVAVAKAMEDHGGLKDLGGRKYVVNLALSAVATSALPDYVAMLADLKSKRDLVETMDRARALIDEGEADADAIAGAIEADLIGRESTGRESLMSFKAAVLAAAEDASKAFESDGVAGASTGIASLDKMIGGLFPGDLVIVGGRPSMGKTAVALSMALGQARAGGGVAVASMEMTGASLAARAISEATANAGRGVPYSDIRKGLATGPQVENFIRCAQDVAELPIMIIPPHVRDIGALYAAAKRAKKIMDGRGCGLKMLVVDYLQLIRSSKQSRLDQISEISMALKGLAMQLEVPVVALSQLSRGVENREDKRPIMSDLRESGQIEQDADVILFCYRDEYYAQRQEPEHEGVEYDEWADRMKRVMNRLDLIVAKQRMGEVGTITVGFNPAFNVVWEVAR